MQIALVPLDLCDRMGAPMRNISNLDINFDVDYAKRHRSQLAHFFEYLKDTSQSNIHTPLLAYPIKPTDFDKLGTLWLPLTDLNLKSRKLLQIIEDSYMSTSFFMVKGDKIGSRGHVYYNTAVVDDDLMRAFLRFINHTSISVQLLEDLYANYDDSWEFGIYALLDDIRYKTLILDDAHPGLLNYDHMTQVINMFYDYAQGTMPTAVSVQVLCERLTAALLLAIELSEPPVLRTYKEADHPLQNIIFRETVADQLEHVSIDTIIGIRFGGSELPHIVQKYFPDVFIQKVRVSKYSNNSADVKIDPSVSVNKSILVLDDNVLTGRTLATIVRVLNQQAASNIYFGCVTYAGFKRYHQMLMEGHGVINPEVLLRSCVVEESEYTKITNSQSYKNRNGVFDKIKSQLQKRITSLNVEYKL